jgi:hypothetical protein
MKDTNYPNEKSTQTGGEGNEYQTNKNDTKPTKEFDFSVPEKKNDDIKAGNNQSKQDNGSKQNMTKQNNEDETYDTPAKERDQRIGFETNEKDENNEMTHGDNLTDKKYNDSQKSRKNTDKRMENDYPDDLTKNDENKNDEGIDPEDLNVKTYDDDEDENANTRKNYINKNETNEKNNFNRNKQ